MTVRHNLQLRLVIVGTFIVLAGFFTASDPLHDRTAEIIVCTEGAISQAPLLGMAVFLSLAMSSAMVAFFSSAVFAPVAVYAWGKARCFALFSDVALFYFFRKRVK